MTSEGENNISDVVQNLPAMAADNPNKPAGTVVTSNGQRVTLGERGRRNTAISPPKRGMNGRKK